MNLKFGNSGETLNGNEAQERLRIVQENIYHIANCLALDISTSTSYDETYSSTTLSNASPEVSYEAETTPSNSSNSIAPEQDLSYIYDKIREAQGA